MRYAISWVIGVACFVLSFKGLTWTFSQIRVHVYMRPQFPVEYGIGRYDIGIADRELTLVGYALMALAIVIAVSISAAYFYKTLSPWMVNPERATFRAWWFISIFLVFSLSIFQLLGYRFSDGPAGFVVSALELAIPAYASWKTWLWRKRETARNGKDT